jgi:hypothetical protein
MHLEQTLLLHSDAALLSVHTSTNAVTAPSQHSAN